MCVECGGHLLGADERVAPWAGTAWGVVAATNTYMHHVQNVRRVGRADRNTERMILKMDDIAGLQTRTLRQLAEARA